MITERQKGFLLGAMGCSIVFGIMLWGLHESDALVTDHYILEEAELMPSAYRAIKECGAVEGELKLDSWGNLECVTQFLGKNVTFKSDDWEWETDSLKMSDLFELE